MFMFRLRYGFIAALVFLRSPLFAQLEPQGSEVYSYFPQISDGGPPDQHWTTSLIFVNPNATLQAIVAVWLIGDNGQPLTLDFGNGAVSTLTFTVSPQGRVTQTTSGLSSSIITGWVRVFSTLPLQTVAQFSFSVNGIPQQGVTSQSIQPSLWFRSPATATTGIALANVEEDQSVPVVLSAIDANGRTIGTSTITLGSLEHKNSALLQLIPGISASFQGTVLIRPSAPHTILAWTLSTEGQVLASYPPSGMTLTVSQPERLFKIWEKLLAAAAQAVSWIPNGSLKLSTNSSAQPMNTFAAHSPGDNVVGITGNLAELFADSDGELSFVLGHELGHVIQYDLGLRYFSDSQESDADEYGTLLSLVAGYDPYGGVGALAKLAMASGPANFTSPDFDNLRTNGFKTHDSFVDRQGKISAYILKACSLESVRDACALYRGAIQRYFPVTTGP